MTDFNKNVIFNSFIKKLFNQLLSNRINKLHKRGLRALLNDEISTIKDILSQSNDTKTHVKKIQTLMTEFYKYLYGFSAPMIQEVFTKISLTLFRMGFFGAAHGWWGAKGPAC